MARVQQRPEEPQHERDETDGRVCPECGGRVVSDDTEVVCEACGLVVQTDTIDHGPEWVIRDSDDAEQKRRVGAPRTAMLHDHGLGSRIGDDTHGDGVLTERHRDADTRAMFRSKVERNRARLLTEVRRLAGCLDLAEARQERAAVLAREAHDAGLSQGRSLDGVAAAAVYAQLRVEAAGYRLRDIVEAARASETLVRGCFSVLQRELDIQPAIPDPRDDVHRLAAALEVPPAVRGRAVQVVDRLDDAGLLVGKAPSGVAAAAVYRASRELQGRPGHVIQADAAEAAGTSSNTLRSRLADIRDLLDGGDSA